jgi:outer membrane protein
LGDRGFNNFLSAKPINLQKKSPMKYISTVISLLALVAVCVLAIVVVNQSGQLKKISSDEKRVAPSSFRVGYFDMDSLEAHYDYFKDAQSLAKAQENAMNMELTEMQRKNQKKILEWRQKGNTMTQAEGEAAQQEFNQMQQDMQNRKDALQQDFYKKTEDMRTNIRKTIEDYLKEYNKQRTYAFIFAYDPSSYIYYRDTIYNITSDLLQGLNAGYKKKN